MLCCVVLCCVVLCSVLFCCVVLLCCGSRIMMLITACCNHQKTIRNVCSHMISGNCYWELSNPFNKRDGMLIRNVIQRMVI